MSEEEQQENPQEIEASQNGWMPEEEFREKFGDDKPWKPAEQFNNDGKFMKKLDAQHYQIEKQTQTIEALNKKMEVFAETSKAAIKLADERALEKLKQQRTEAMDEGDYDKVDSLNNKIETKIEEKTIQPETPEPVETPNIYAVQNAKLDAKWSLDHPWYETDKEKTDYSRRVFQNLELAGEVVYEPGTSNIVNYEEVLDRINSYVEKNYKGDGGQNAPAMGKPKQSSSKDDYSEKYDDSKEKAIAVFVQQGMTREQVIDNWRTVGLVD